MTTHRTPTRAVASRRLWSYACSSGLLLLPALCLATDVRVVAVTPGRSAEVVIEHGAPVTLEVGETIDGVKLLRADRSGAVLSIDGTTKTLKLGDAAAFGEASAPGIITLSADRHGQFFTSGTVNGRAVHFIVDTGATVTALSRADARRIGLDFRGGRPVQAMTVNGMVHGWSVSLGSVRVGDVTEQNVDAVVIDNDSLPLALLGMSFLGRFDMHRQGASLVLRRRH